MSANVRNHSTKITVLINFDSPQNMTEEKKEVKVNMVLFTNWLNEEFVGKWAGTEEVFTAGQSKYLEDWKALHYAKHLVDQYLNSKGIPTNHFSRDKLTKKCFGEVIESNKTQVKSEIFNKNKDLEKKKETPPETKEPEKPKEEEKKPAKEFQDLNA